MTRKNATRAEPRQARFSSVVVSPGRVENSPMGLIITPEFRFATAQGRLASRKVSKPGCLRVTQRTEGRRFQLAGLGGGCGGGDGGSSRERCSECMLIVSLAGPDQVLAF
jgi:hypothetical protein